MAGGLPEKAYALLFPGKTFEYTADCASSLAHRLRQLAAEVERAVPSKLPKPTPKAGAARLGNLQSPNACLAACL